MFFSTCIPFNPLFLFLFSFFFLIFELNLQTKILLYHFSLVNLVIKCSSVWDHLRDIVEGHWKLNMEQNEIYLICLYIIILVSTILPMFSLIFIYAFVLHHLHYTWFRYIKSCIEDPSIGFLTRWKVIHSRFLKIANLFKVVVYYLIIGRIICLSH